ncbi:MULTISPECIES: hypothetical protein [unclassified Sedimentibacter]|uniref:hypothetical protein n=1 Tax=unclassified Sedimentibacter TaxID=2649220 RepID=UPI0027DEB40A|nr:hypothetical protein [Sedimentibacter sp. MB35-C1]WMJ76075.1 hypothetical protein RBQ61_10605 [Sedimentibacter sp. MB35-C1]
MEITKMLFALIVLLIIPFTLFYVEYRLAKAQSKLAVILPVVVLCFSVIMPIVALTGIIMFVIYFVVKYLEKEKKNKLSEIDKMNIQDLE